MGQGAESAGGYEVGYNPWEEGLAEGNWYQKRKGYINVSEMSLRHLRNTLKLCERAEILSTFECDKDLWIDWQDVLSAEIASRPTEPTIKSKKPVRGRTRKMKCHCGTIYFARIADLNRGWGLSCSKSCSAIRRAYGRPAATYVEQEISP